MQDLHFHDSQEQQFRQKQRSVKMNSLLSQILPLLCSILESENRNEVRFLTYKGILTTDSDTVSLTDNKHLLILVNLKYFNSTWCLIHNLWLLIIIFGKS